MALRARLVVKSAGPAVSVALGGVVSGAVRAVEHGVALAAAPDPEGRSPRVHEPLVLLRELDALSPALYTALLRGEAIPELELQLLGDGRLGQTDQPVLRLILGGATVQALRLRKLDPEDPPGRAHPDLEELVLRYEAITWRWSLGEELVLRDRLLGPTGQSERT